jgi:Acetyltransferase (GNAT) domain
MDAFRSLPRELGDGLILRSARREDLDAMAEFIRWVFAESNGGEPDETAVLMLREYMSPDHPTTSPGDHVLVEDQASGKIVSMICLVPQTWSYGGIPFGVSRPELVGTDPAYRSRGLVRAQMEALHALSEERGDLIQAITGIPYFYRQFGYEKALITSDGRYGLPKPLKEPEQPAPYRLRSATEDDLPLIVRGHEIAAQRRLVAAVRDESTWKWELLNRLPGSDYLHTIWVIERGDGTPTGVLANQTQFDWRRPIMWATFCELFEGESWPEATPIIMEHLRQEAIKLREGDESVAVGFDWGADHPFVELEANTLQGTVRPFSWLIRIPDLVKFLHHITPVLNERLSKSHFHRYDGELILTFYQSGLKLKFANGQIAEIANFRPPSHREAGAGFPELTFYYLLLGSRTFDELEYAFLDCWVRKQADRVLLNVLFPKIPSSVWPL